MPVMRLLVRASGLAVVCTLCGVVAGCCSTPGIPPKHAFNQVNSPEVTIALFRQALEAGDDDHKNLLYYLLSRDTRKRYSFDVLSTFYSEVRKEIGPLMLDSRLLRVDYLDESPHPPSPAAIAQVEYTNSEGQVVRESFLLLLELAADQYPERFPQWRIYFNP